jgi:glutamate-1-semialdehyde 2,1-aminomutase
MTDEANFSRALLEAEHEYIKRTEKSKLLNDKAAAYLPGGDTRQACYFKPYPTYIKSGEGSYLYDVDGNKYIDVLNNYTQQIHGHNHPRTKEAVIRQLQNGTIFGSPHEAQIELAELLCNRIPSVERIRFCNSGTEATMFAIKGARAYTGKDKIIKCEGMYHGTHDLVEGSVFPPLTEAGDPFAPNVVASNAGIPANIFENLVVVPFNDIEAFETALEKNSGEVAAVIIEPVLGAGGVIPANPDFLQAVRRLTSDKGIVLIFDEVVSFRLSTGGAQELYNIIPDLTTLGKFIGGGFPIGAFGGREDIMDVFSPSESVFAAGGNKVKHSGTFNGHPVIMIAGLATMQDMTPEVYQKINLQGDKFRNNMNNEVFKKVGLKAQVTGIGSLSFLHYTLEKINNYRDIKKGMDAAGNLFALVHLEALNQGIWIAERGEIAISTPMTDLIINEVTDKYLEIYMKIKPVLERDLPFLVY